MRKVVLVSLDWTRPGDPRTGLGTASIAAACRAAGVPVQVVGDAVNREGFDADTFVHNVVTATRDAGPGALVGVGAFVWNEPEVQHMLSVLQGETDARVVLGGPQVSYTPKGELDGLYPGVNYFVRGHAEDAVPALACVDVAEGEHGVHLRGAADRGEIALVNLAALPSPHLDGYLPVGRYVRWETQRGCVFACSFCQHREVGGRSRRGPLGAARLSQEIEVFADAGVLRISVLDPIFHSDPRRAVALLREMKRVGLRAQLSLQCRFELIDNAFLDALVGLNVVLEFGLQTIHEIEGKAIHRPNDVRKAEQVIAELHARGIPFEVSLIYGLPHQTLDTFRRSVDWCLEQRVPRVRAWPLMLLRGTAMYTQRDRWGFVESVGERIPIVVQSNTFSQLDHEEMARIAMLLGHDMLARAAA